MFPDKLDAHLDICQSFKKMDSITINGQEYRSKQIVMAFPTTDTFIIRGAFTRTDLHPAKINYLALHTQSMEDVPSLTMFHPLQTVSLL